MIPPDQFDLSTGNLTLQLSIQDRHLRLDCFGLDGSSWLSVSQPSSLFAVTVNGQRHDSSQMIFENGSYDSSIPGVTHAVFHFSGPGFAVDHHVEVYQDHPVVEMWLVITCRGPQTCQVSRVDSFSLAISPTAYELLYFTGDWGQEFEPVQTLLEGKLILESRSGRSSKDHHPWFALTSPAGVVLTGSVAWSGNWALRFEPTPEGGYLLNGGLHDWSFAKDLPPGGIFAAPPVVLALGKGLDDVSRQYTRVGRAHWYPRSPLASRCPVEWNHWWPYQDNQIDETVFKNNVVEAEKLGLEVCTLDAGWFGPGKTGSDWYAFRGDWERVNTRRFPNGIRSLSDFTHAHGMSFGLWCEIEGLGASAQLAIDQPEFVASRDGVSLGCVCFGSPAVQEWAYRTLTGLVEKYHVDWIKLDFNLDPGAGCSRADHGHGPGDGLYEHVMGYYRTLDRVRQAYPSVVLENCSSGGLRIDLGILRRTHLAFLSDPDWPVHDLQIFWGATQMLAPGACLHWSFCEWPAAGHPPQQTFNPRDPRLTRAQLDTYTRISMLGLLGFSQKLPDLTAWVSERLAFHVSLYKKQVRRFIAGADLFHLTRQPRRSGAGDRWAAFQYSLPDCSEHLLFVFRLSGSPPERRISLAGLDPTRIYTIEDFEGEFSIRLSGKDLIDPGLLFDHLPEEGSALLKIY